MRRIRDFGEKLLQNHFVLCIILTFVFTLLFLVGLLYLSARIPNDWIRDNLAASLAYLEEEEDEFYYYRDTDRRTLIDNYADAIEFNVMYYAASSSPLENLFISPFYSDQINPDYEMIAVLRKGMEEGMEADTLYDRYWHGMQLLWRPLFVFAQIDTIRILVTGVLLLCLVLLMAALWKKKQRVFVFSLLAGAFLIAYPMLGMCMEYVPTFLIMFFISGACMKHYGSRKKTALWLLVSGMCCAFFDILTTETVAFVIPLALSLCLRERERKPERFWDEIRFTIVCGILWVLGYLGVFFCKWTLASLTLKNNRFQPAITMLLFRQGGKTAGTEADGLPQSIAALAENVRLISGFPSEIKGSTALLIVLVLTGAVLCFVYVYRKTGRECILPLLLGILGLVPIARFLILNSHSYDHSYFTYRALFATIVCLITAFAGIIDWDLLKKERGYGKKWKL